MTSKQTISRQNKIGLARDLISDLISFLLVDKTKLDKIDMRKFRKSVTNFKDMLKPIIEG